MKRNLVTAILVLMVCNAAIAEPVTPDRVRVGPELMSTRVATKVDPIYPAKAKQEHVQGTVTLRVEISKEGDIEYVKLISGHPMLAPAAIEAVKQWKYRPYLLDGQAVRVVTTVTVNFTLAQ